MFIVLVHEMEKEKVETRLLQNLNIGHWTNLLSVKTITQTLFMVPFEKENVLNAQN